MTTDPSCPLINRIRVLTYHQSRVAQWADAEVDQSAPQITTNPDGSKTVITYRINDDGKKVKVTQKIKEVVVRETVNKSVAARKKWAKFGAEKNAAPGPDFRTTQIGDPVFLRLGTSWKALEKAEEDKAEEDKAKSNTAQRLKCRACGGAHYTSKCPFKDSLGAVDSALEGDAAAAAAPLTDATPAAPGRFVPRHLRAGAGPEDRRERDDSSTLKIMQLNEIVTEDMIRDELLSGFGYIVRCNILRNRETGRSRGMAFVQFASETAAQSAMDHLNGRGYHNLILHIEWSKPRK